MPSFKRTFAAFLLAFALVSGGRVEAREWEGSYVYLREVPNDFLRLEVRRQGKGYRAVLFVAAPGSDRETIVADLVEVGEEASVRFVVYNDGRDTGFARGVELFGLRYERGSLVTRWGALKPEGATRSGSYFQRSVD